MSWRECLIVGVQYKQWDLGIGFSPIDSKLFGKQVVWEMDSPLTLEQILELASHLVSLFSVIFFYIEWLN